MIVSSAKPASSDTLYTSGLNPMRISNDVCMQVYIQTSKYCYTHQGREACPLLGGCPSLKDRLLMMVSSLLSTAAMFLSTSLTQVPEMVLSFAFTNIIDKLTKPVTMSCI